MDNEQLQKFWKSFNAWIESNEVLEKLFRGECIQWDKWNGGTFYLTIDYNTEYIP